MYTRGSRWEPPLEASRKPRRKVRVFDEDTGELLFSYSWGELDFPAELVLYHLPDHSCYKLREGFRTRMPKAVYRLTSMSEDTATYLGGEVYVEIEECEPEIPECLPGGDSQ